MPFTHPFVKQPTRLTKFIREKRGETSQSDYQAELERLACPGDSDWTFGRNYLSRMEQGLIRELKDDFVRAFSASSGQSEEMIRRMHAELLEAAPAAGLESGAGPLAASPVAVASMVKTYSLVAGHTFWVAPILAAVFRGINISLREHLRVSTCGQHNVPNPESRSSIEWHPLAKDALWVQYPDREQALQKAKYFEAKLYASGTPTRFYNAQQAIWALESGWADLIAVPTAFIEDKKETIRSLARLVIDTACVLICSPTLTKRLFENRIEKIRGPGKEPKTIYDRICDSWNSKRIDACQLDTRELGSLLGHGDHLGGEIGTVSARLIEEAAEYATGDKDDRATLLYEIESHRALDEELSGLKDFHRCTSEKDRGKGLQGVILWEPYATWAYETLMKQGGEAYAFVTLRHDSTRYGATSPLFEFALATTEAKVKDKMFIQIVKELLMGTQDASVRIYQNRMSDSNVENELLARYFNLGKGERVQTLNQVKRIIDSIYFNVSIRPDDITVLV